MDEGYIKYCCHWENKAIELPDSTFQALNQWRNKFYQLGLIGIYSNGIGFGNISCIDENGDFYISGSATGGKHSLSASDYAKITSWNFEENELSCIGQTKASSESLSHAAIYESSDTIKAVIHIHSKKMWLENLTKLPTTKSDVAYGTPEMAYAIEDIASSAKPANKGIIVMGGHEEGILAYGQTLGEAGQFLLKNLTSF